MTWNPKTLATLKRLNHVKRLLKDLFVDRDTAVELLVLASVCQEHFWLQAFADRFVLRQQLELVPDERLEALLEQG